MTKDKKEDILKKNKILVMEKFKESLIANVIGFLVSYFKNETKEKISEFSELLKKHLEEQLMFDGCELNKDYPLSNFCRQAKLPKESLPDKVFIVNFLREKFYYI